MAIVQPGKPAVREAPAPPASFTGKELLPHVRETWERFWLSPISGSVDLDAHLGRLEWWIRTVNERELVAAIVATRRTDTGSMGQSVANPLIKYLNDLNAQIERAEQAYGMTPLAAFRLGIEAGEAALTADEVNRRLNRGSA